MKKFIIGSSLDKRINNFQPLIYSTTSFIRINDGLKELIYPICNLLPKSISTYVMIAIAEEVIFRFTFQRGLHYLQESLKEKIPEGYGKDSYLLSPSFRCLTTSLVFGFAHILNHKADKRTTALPQCLIIILFANAMSIQYETYDSLACPILSHFLFNFFVFNCSKIPHIDRILVSLFFAYTTGLAISSFIPDKKNVGNAITSNSSFETPD
ncbi:MAG: CPBP family intramembrane glutamic endopeptidase [Candidatus Algichlamydia australiensis]|nr:CPBP family intramembrane glutamic endopeptidase [Chlamydiales bacterium]